MFQGMQYRDTDWYETTAAGGPVTMTGTAEFPLQIILIYGADCINLQYDLTHVDACEEAQLSHDMGPGATVWLWAAPYVFEGVPESTYYFTVCGIEDSPVAVEPTTWGRIKNQFSTERRSDRP